MSWFEQQETQPLRIKAAEKAVRNLENLLFGRFFMYTKLILKGANLGGKIGFYLSTIYAILIYILAIYYSSSHSSLAPGLFLIYLLMALFFGILPATLVGAISGLVVGMGISLELKFVTRLGRVRTIFWWLVGLTILLTFLVNALLYRDWIWFNAKLVLMISMYFDGLFWVGWRLYHQKRPDKVAF